MPEAVYDRIGQGYARFGGPTPASACGSTRPSGLLVGS